jgi:hypothetical protein
VAHGFSPEVQARLDAALATGKPPSGIDPTAKDNLADEINNYGTQIIDLAWNISEQRSVSQVGPHEIVLATIAADRKRETFDWPGWGGGFALGVFGNSIFDWFPFKDLTPITAIIALASLAAAGVFGGFAVRRAHAIES